MTKSMHEIRTPNPRLMPRRDFLCRATAAAAFPMEIGTALDNLLVTGSTSNPEMSGGTSATFSDAHEMKAAEDWLHALTVSATGWKKQSKASLLPELLKPPFSFIYDSRPSSDLISTWEQGSLILQLTKAGKSHEVTYTDPQTNLVIRLVVLQYKYFPAVEWVVYFQNSGTMTTPILEDIQALDTKLLSPWGDPIIHYAKGATCSMDDFMPLTRRLNIKGEQHIEPGGGRSSSDFMPFFNFETQDEGMIIALGWTGEWAMNFSRPEGASVRLRAGMARTHLKLHSGEKIRTPRILILFWRGHPLRGNNLLRRLLLSHYRPEADDKPVRMPMCNINWGATPAAVHIENIHQIVAHKLPMDYYWIDAEWFGSGPWWSNAGDWSVKKDLYPEGFKPISDLLHRSGLKFLLWFEPERVCEGTPWYTEHANWLLEVPPNKRAYNWGTSQEDPDWVRRESLRNQIKENDRLFNLGIAEARQFLTDFISAKIDEFGIDCYRHDANIAPLEFWRAADAPDRQGITEIRWVEGLYAFWDELKRRHPDLVIDVCASGGRRIDLETISRCLPLWRTDFPNSNTGKQCHTYGLLRWVPLNSTTVGNLGNGTIYDLRSSMCSGLVFSLFDDGVHTQPQKDYVGFPFDRVKKVLERQRKIETYFYGDYYPLTEYSQAEDAWEAYQLDLTDKQEGLIVVLKRSRSDYVSAIFPLRALDHFGFYEMSDLDKRKRWLVPGSKLIKPGLELALPNKPDSALILYRRIR